MTQSKIQAAAEELARILPTRRATFAQQAIPILSRVASEARREALEEASKATCFNCREPECNGAEPPVLIEGTWRHRIPSIRENFNFLCDADAIRSLGSKEEERE